MQELNEEHSENKEVQELKADEANNETSSEETEETIESLQAKVKELQDQYLRVYADFENTKKRMLREKDQSLEYAYERFARDLLPVIDTLESALKSVEDSNNDDEVVKKIGEGVSLTLDNLLKILVKHGIEPIDTQGEFDPNFHDAIMQVPSEAHEDGQIVAELQKGYKYKERVLRPSMVSIAKN